MYYAAVLAPDKRVIKAEGGSLPLALYRLREAWNDHVVAHQPQGMLLLDMHFDFDVGMFQRTFNRVEHHWIITTQLMAVGLFIDTIADEQG